jgi:hypothetical protein
MAGEQRVAIGRLLGDHVGADEPASAQTAFDNDALAQRLAEMRRHQA